MKKIRSNKSALLISGLLLLASVSMFAGSTYAWYKDSVTSSGNIVQAGTIELDLEVYDTQIGRFTSIKRNGDPIFTCDEWEPGYTEIQILRLENDGSLDAKWAVSFVTHDELSDLADVIDVYVQIDKNPISFFSLDEEIRVGTLKSFVNTVDDGLCGNLKSGEAVYIGIALKMQDNASMDYHGMELDGTFNIQFVATQIKTENVGSGISFHRY